jgi:hypothetical protein
MKPLNSKALQGRQSHADFNYTSWFEVVDDSNTFEDIFDPRFWQHQVGSQGLKTRDLVRLVHPRGLFDIVVVIRTKMAGGIMVDYYGGIPPEGIDPRVVAADELNAAMKIKPCPIDRDGRPVAQIHYTAKTNWRIIGLNSAEVKRDIPSKAEAENELAIYLNSMRMRLPTAEEIAAELELRSELAKAKQAQVDAADAARKAGPKKADAEKVS